MSRSGAPLPTTNFIDFRNGLMHIVAHGVLALRRVERRLSEAGQRWEPILRDGEALYERPDGEFFIDLHVEA